MIRECTDLFRQYGIESPEFEAKQLVCGICRISQLDLVKNPDRRLNTYDVVMVQKCVNRRLAGEPLQYLIGEWEFYGLPFKVGPGVLIPRQDTETLARIALDYITDHQTDEFAAADLCAGSGCVGVTLAARQLVPVTLVENSPVAFDYMTRNIRLNAVEELCTPIFGDVLEEYTAQTLGSFDLITANPPYLSAKDMTELQTEVTFEPKEALYGGEDGLDFYRRMVPIWAKSLKSGGLMAVEIGMGQDEAVMRIFEECGIIPQRKKDYCGIYRVVYGIGHL